MRIDKPRFSKDDVLTVSIDVTNTGNMEGKESVLLYSTDLVASLTPENRRLRAFEKVSLQPQETRTVTFRLPAKDLSFVGADGQWVLEEGDFRLTIGSEQQTITCE
jgi:beta-glucosidase